MRRQRPPPPPPSLAPCSASVTADAGQATITLINELVKTGVPSATMESFETFASDLSLLVAQLPAVESKTDGQMAALLVTSMRTLGRAHRRQGRPPHVAD